MTTTPDPLTGPFPTGRELTDYREMPGYAILPRLHQPERPSAVADALSRLGYSTRDDEKAA